MAGSNCAMARSSLILHPRQGLNTFVEHSCNQSQPSLTKVPNESMMAMMSWETSIFVFVVVRLCQVEVHGA